VVKTPSLINALKTIDSNKQNLENNTAQETTTPAPPLKGGEFVVITCRLRNSNKTFENQDLPKQNQVSKIR